jgi:hypothetical protein
VVAAWAIGALLIRARVSRSGLKVVLSMKSLGGGDGFQESSVVGGGVGNIEK